MDKHSFKKASFVFGFNFVPSAMIWSESFSFFSFVFVFVCFFCLSVLLVVVEIIRKVQEGG